MLTCVVEQHSTVRLLTLCRVVLLDKEEVVPALEYILEPTYSTQCKRRGEGSSVLSGRVDKRLNLPS